MLELPATIRAWLVETIERSWPEPAAVVAALPTALPPGEVRSLAAAGPYGLRYDGRLDEIGGRVALEVLENSRMSGESYFRVWDDGTIEPLEPAPRAEFAYAREEERESAEQAYFAHNRMAYAHLRGRGFAL